MTAPDPGTTEAPTDTSSEELSPEALRFELKRARDDAAKYRQRAKEFGDDEQYRRAKEAVAAVEKAEQEKKTEVEKLTERSEQLLSRSARAETELSRLRVALDAVSSGGIAASQVDEFAARLRGDTDDELKADAEHLAAFFTAAASPPAAAPRRGDPSQGAGGHREPSPGDALAAYLHSTISAR